MSAKGQKPLGVQNWRSRIRQAEGNRQVPGPPLVEEKRRIGLNRGPSPCVKMDGRAKTPVGGKRKVPQDRTLNLAVRILFPDETEER